MVTMTDEELCEAIDGLMAHDVGAVDSGVSDEALRSRVRAELASRTVADVEALALTIHRPEDGYGPEDLTELRQWLRDEMNVPLDA